MAKSKDFGSNVKVGVKYSSKMVQIPGADLKNKGGANSPTRGTSVGKVKSVSKNARNTGKV
jgi:hypothetical protein